MKKRELKQLINGYADEVLLDCLLLANLSEEVDAQKLEGLVEGVVTARNEAVARMNAFVAKNDKKAIRSYYTSLKADFFKKIEEAAAAIDTIIQPK